MGYFNFAYKLMRMFSMLGFFYRRHKKLCKILIIILLALLTFHYLSVNGYCAQADSTYTTDTSYYILEEYNNICNDLVVVYDKYYGVHQGKTTLFDNMFQAIQNGSYPYLYINPNSINFTNIYLYNYSFTKTLVDTSLVYNDYTRIPSTCWNLTYPAHTGAYFINRTTFNYGYNDGTNMNVDINIPIPTILYMKIPQQMIDIMERSGIGYNGSQDSIVNIESLLNDIETNGQITNNKLNDINDSLEDMTSEEVEEGVVDIPEVDINDPTESGFNNIYTTVINYLGYDYSSNHTYWTFTIPFINKNITYMARSYACSIQSKWLGCSYYIC